MKPDDWYYNAGFVGANIIKQFPYLAHRVENIFGVNYIDCLYYDNCKDWKDSGFKSVHLLFGHRSYLDPNYNKTKELDEYNIMSNKNTIGEMFRTILYKINQS